MRFPSFLRCCVVLMGLMFAGHVSHAQFAPGGGGGQKGFGINSVRPDSNHPPVVHNRVIQGYVRDANGKAEPGAVIYLKNKQTSNIQSVFPDAQGEYRIGNLAQGADYEVWAVLNQKSGPTRTVSQYDTRDALIYNLETK